MDEESFLFNDILTKLKSTKAKQEQKAKIVEKIQKMASQTKMETIDINDISGNYDVEAAVVQAEPSNDQERIASAKIVYIVAVSGCGKSFTGDYLETMHGFHHVDGGKLR